MSPRDQDLLDLLAGLTACPSPAGRERPLAEWLVRWASARWPAIDWRLHPFGRTRANVTARAVSGRSAPLVLYSHLDTSLAGDPRWDRFISGDTPPERRLRLVGDTVSGPGVAVAKGPAAAALLGFVEVVEELRGAGRNHDLTLLLAAGGTHRAAPPGQDLDGSAPSWGAGAGVRHFLARRRPAAAVVAKAGPTGVLHEEPGAAFLVVRVEGASGPVMARAHQLPDGGLPTAAGAAARGVEEWRRGYIRRPLPAASQVGREVGVGAIRCGLPYKPDLVGGVLELYVYAVTGPDDDLVELASGLRAAVAGSLARQGREVSVAVEPLSATPAAGTDPDSRIGRAAAAAWGAAKGGPPPEIRGWTGSTDGVLFRQAGVDTVRLGPAPVAAPPGGEALSWSDLRHHVTLYAGVAREWVAH